MPCPFRLTQPPQLFWKCPGVFTAAQTVLAQWEWLISPSRVTLSSPLSTFASAEKKSTTIVFTSDWSDPQRSRSTRSHRLTHDVLCSELFTCLKYTLVTALSIRGPTSGKYWRLFFWHHIHSWQGKNTTLCVHTLWLLENEQIPHGHSSLVYKE